MFAPTRKSALFVDFDNLIPVYGRPLLDNIRNWLAWLERGEFDPQRIRRKFVTRRVYWNTENDTHRQSFLRHRFDVHLCRAIRKEKASSADFDITIQAVDVRHERPGVKEFIILSFDTDFSSVLLHLQLEDRVGVGMVDASRIIPDRETATSKYTRILDLAIDKEAFRDAFSYQNAKDRQRGGAPSPQPTTPNAVDASPPAATPSSASPRASIGAPTPAKAAASVRFDIAAAADLIAQAAEKNGIVYLGRDRVRKLLKGLPRFHSRAGPWGGASYKTTLDELVRLHPEKFQQEKMRNGGIVLVYRAAAKSSGPAQSSAA
jgi:hypothetical protein